eukprot:GHVL01008337.1.p1 GENE.GHVL01008337.1~~GHVL01008337.1.p1  ORF type:complete len:206 (+),score=33.84 GHVL01008337.1:236-853(+)
MPKPDTYKYNLLVLGERAVGKTSLILRFCDDVFHDNYIATLGVDLKKHELNVAGSRVQLQIWDTAGQERYRTITPNYYRQAAGIILIYDISRADTFQLIDTWIRGIEDNAVPGVQLILIGNKSDLDSIREVPKQTAQAVAQRLNIPFFECSAKTGNAVAEAFSALGEKVHMHAIGDDAVIPSSDAGRTSFKVTNDTTSKKKKKCC